MSRKNLIISLIVWGLILLLIVIFIALWNWSKLSKTKKTSWNFTVWIFWDSKEKFEKFLTKFKTVAWYKWLNPVVESFSDYWTYSKALTRALAKWKWPDVFVMNNNEKAFFDENIIALDPSRFTPNTFRNKLEWFFADDLLYSDWKDDKKVDFSIWVPVWFETLWIFYNKQRWDKSYELENWAKLSAHIDDLYSKRPYVIPLWIWDWTTTKYSSDIFTQFLMLSGKNNIENISDKIKEALWQYYLDQTNNWIRLYNSRKSSLLISWKNNIDLFSRWDIAMIIWYPRMLLDIDKKWFSKRFLEAAPFPWYFNWTWNMLVNYNYFVVNKDTKNSKVAFDLLEYMLTEEWASEYLKEFPYYLPALRSLVAKKSEELIMDWYRVTLWNFYNDNLVFSSFDKWVKSLYDKWVSSLLDDRLNSEKLLENFISWLVCKTKKIYNQENLSSICK